MLFKNANLFVNGSFRCGAFRVENGRFSELLDCKNDTVTGDGFPMLKPRTTTIACAGNVQRIEVIPRWCCL